MVSLEISFYPKRNTRRWIDQNYQTVIIFVLSTCRRVAESFLQSKKRDVNMPQKATVRSLKCDDSFLLSSCFSPSERTVRWRITFNHFSLVVSQEGLLLSFEFWFGRLEMTNMSHVSRFDWKNHYVKESFAIILLDTWGHVERKQQIKGRAMEISISFNCSTFASQFRLIR